MIALGVLIAGGVGALSRYRLEGLVAQRQRSPFPLSTLIINVTGSAALGVVAGLGARAGLSEAWVAWLGTGLIGGYTTFSTFTYETLQLAEDGAWRYVAWNIALSGPLSFCAAAATYLATR